MTTKWASCSEPIVRLPFTTRGEKDAVLMEDWHINDVCGFRFTVPAGTSTDGASIPRFLWRLCGHPLKAPRVYAALLHDWLYECADPEGWTDGAMPSEITRKEADACYMSLSRHFGIPWWKAKLEHTALRWFGGKHYKGKSK